MIKKVEKSNNSLQELTFSFFFSPYTVISIISIINETVIRTPDLGISKIIATIKCGAN